MKIEIIGCGPNISAQLDEILFGTSTINRKNPFEEAMDKLIKEVRCGEAKTIIFDSLGDIMEEVEKDAVGKYSGKPICFDIQSITANHKKNAFTVVWGDGSHTMIHLQPGDVWDDEKALAMCFVKHMMGDTGSFNDIFTTEMPKKIKHIGKVEPVTGPTVADEPKEDVSHATKDTVDTIKYGEDSFKRLGESSAKATEAIVSADKSMKELVDFLTGDTVETPLYEAYIRTTAGKKYRIVHRTDKYSLATNLRHYVKNSFPSCVGTPWRVWNTDEGMYIDFGASDYFVVPGMTTEKWFHS